MLAVILTTSRDAADTLPLCTCLPLLGSDLEPAWLMYTTQYALVCGGAMGGITRPPAAPETIPMHDLRSILEQWGILTQTLYQWLDTDRGPIFCLRAQAAQCAGLWRDLHALVEETGRYPVLLGTAGDLEYHRAKMAEWPEQSTTAWHFWWD